MSSEEIEAGHRKELKALEGEKRATLKKTKATAGKGKKGKEKLAEVEAQFATKLKELQEKHSNELAALSETTAEGAAASTAAGPVSSTTDGGGGTDPEEERERKQKQAKARKKREKAKEKERERELQIERENAEMGPSARQMEVDQIQQQIASLGLQIVEIPSDGNCLYRAVAAHSGSNYQETRKLCADTLMKNEAEFAPFCEYDDDKVPDFNQYVERVRSSSDWGGHLELRVLSLALQKHIFVYSAQTKEPLHIKPDGGEAEDAKPIRLSYHLHYYALGEHYNQVVEATETA